MYPTKPIFDYMNWGEYFIMPPGLPDRFYPTDKSKVYYTNDYVITFPVEISEEKKERFIRDYAEYYKKEKESGVFR